MAVKPTQYAKDSAAVKRKLKRIENLLKAHKASFAKGNARTKKGLEGEMAMIREGLDDLIFILKP